MNLHGSWPWPDAAGVDEAPKGSLFGKMWSTSLIRNLPLKNKRDSLCVMTVVSKPRSPKPLTALCAAFGFERSRLGQPRKPRAQ
jgi:hypothetical protein